MVVLSEDDHLLRRFGQVDVLRFEQDSKLTTHRQEGADEIWAIFSGAVELVLTDMREESPTNQTKMEISLAEEIPRGVLIPFGVNAELYCRQPGLLIRLTSHADGLFPGDQIFVLKENED